jgi:hypothetical protein
MEFGSASDKALFDLALKEEISPEYREFHLEGQTGEWFVSECCSGQFDPRVSS